MRIGAGAVLGERCVLLVHAGAEVGGGARLADGVVICDFEHDHADVERPVRHQPLQADPVTIGARARIGPGAVLGPGARVRAGGTVGAHAVLPARR
ncbi:MAG TPA: hypothetical protein VM266_16320 [Solirubrobacteraceae bacterium]|nr:hypothetical protein [Solirubrobacteraceae bacterium]